MKLSKSVYSKFTQGICLPFVVLIYLFYFQVSAAEKDFWCERYLSGKNILKADLSDLQTEWRILVGHRLSQALVQKSQALGTNYTKMQLSRDIKVDSSSVVKYANGLHSIPLTHAQNISKILDVELNWLLAQDLLIAFNVNGFEVQPEDFKGQGMYPLADAFKALVWSQPKLSIVHDDKLLSDIDPQIFCIEDCSTEGLVKELARRGWDVNLRLKDTN